MVRSALHALSHTIEPKNMVLHSLVSKLRSNINITKIAMNVAKVLQYTRYTEHNTHRTNHSHSDLGVCQWNIQRRN